MKIVKIARPKRENVPSPVENLAEAKRLLKQNYKANLAALMRSNPTRTEQLMIDLLTANNIAFEFQVNILGYIPDFYLKQVKAILEIDGKIHKEQQEYDAHRDKVFKDEGYGVMRIGANFLATQPDKVLAELQGFIKNRKATLKFAKFKKKVRAKKAAKNWRNVPKLGRNHLPKVTK